MIIDTALIELWLVRIIGFVLLILNCYITVDTYKELKSPSRVDSTRILFYLFIIYCGISIITLLLLAMTFITC